MLRLIGILTLLYAGVVLLAWLFQHRLLYLPSTPGREWVATPRAAGLDFEDVRVETGDGIELSAWWIPAREQRGSLLFFHGNAGNISHRLESIVIFNRLGLSVLIVDYRGYGKSSGRPSEEGTYEDARAAWRHLIQERGAPADKAVIFGRSLGAAVAAHLAAAASPLPGALILESAFTSLPDAAARAYPFLPARRLTRYAYTTREYVTRVTSPVLVIHSEDDEIVPLDQGRAVFEAARSDKRFLTLRGSHNTGFLDSARIYQEGIDEFLTETAGL